MAESLDHDMEHDESKPTFLLQSASACAGTYILADSYSWSIQCSRASKVIS